MDSAMEELIRSENESAMEELIREHDKKKSNEHDKLIENFKKQLKMKPRVSEKKQPPKNYKKIFF